VEYQRKFQGRGLGMAAVYGIVKNHEGWISVDSQCGKGTVVRIYFPAAEIQATKGEKPRIELAKGAGAILIIGDEEPVIDVTMAILEKLGYRILRPRRLRAKTGGRRHQDLQGV
jgi:two-component system cell cycle sensor histidine kinase/response regulator CckA